jgi:molybdopterin molybdotransferase
VEHGADTPLALREQLSRIADGVDLIVTTGGISVGEEDHVKPSLAALGGDLHFSGVAIKPGKPVSFGSLGRALWLGLPGNPVSACVTWQVFGTAILRALTGQVHRLPRRRHVTLAAPIRRKPGRCELRPAWLSGIDAQGRELAHCRDATHSARVAGLPQADGLLVLPADSDHLPKGALVEFQPFDDL